MKVLDDAKTEEILSVLKNIPHFAGILDEQGRFILVGDELLDSVVPLKAKDIVGKRLGDILGCKHASETGLGCGTSVACQFCRANNSIVKSLETNRVISVETSIPVVGQIGGLEYRFTFRPYHMAGRPVVLLSFQKGIHQSQLEQYERIFFHDILNASGSLVGLLDAFEPNTGDWTLLRRVAEHIQEEIQSFAMVSKAQRHELAAYPVMLDVGELMERVAALARIHAPDGVAVKVARIPPSRIESDESLLFRILLNMAKNAVEACSPGDVVHISFTRSDGRPVFSVSNPGEMGEEEKVSVFRKGVSTKGPGRGWGTYGMKLIGEEVLGGVLSFSSDNVDGTVFRIELPAEGG
ncbi:MAG: HAMP domain-containing sensor histidine kinase [Spirochaetaceae bacterium]|nr:HAMP domain-containing sensor histidine kinase [Spirochaetaceae bacterium]